MGEKICPNYTLCRLVTTPGFSGSEERRQQYIGDYCIKEQKKWSGCKRYLTKNELDFCPDFVLPDTELSIDEIIDKFDKQND